MLPIHRTLFLLLCIDAGELECWVLLKLDVLLTWTFQR